MPSITVYGHPQCPMMPRTRLLLTAARVPYTYINIHTDPTARAHVRAINNGNESVPTLEFDDGSTLTEPSSMELRTRLTALGYTVSASWLDPLLHHLPMVILGVGALSGALLGAAAGNLIPGLSWGLAGGFMTNMLAMQIAGR